MAISMTAADIKAYLKAAIEQNPACRGVRFDITVRRVISAKPTTAWYASVRPIEGKREDAEACEQAVRDIVEKAQDELKLMPGG
jgi:hypothetical protein